MTIKEPSANVVLLDHISTEKWQDVVDFDDHLDDISKWVQYTMISVLILKNFHVLRVNWCLLETWCTGIGWTQSCSSKLGIAVGIIQYCNGFSTLFLILGFRGQGMTRQRNQMDWSEAPWFLVCDNFSRCEKLDISRLLVLLVFELENYRCTFRAFQLKLLVVESEQNVKVIFASKVFVYLYENVSN